MRNLACQFGQPRREGFLFYWFSVVPVLLELRLLLFQAWNRSTPSHTITLLRFIALYRQRGEPCVACCVSPLHPWTPRLVAHDCIDPNVLLGRRARARNNWPKLLTARRVAPIGTAPPHPPENVTLCRAPAAENWGYSRVEEPSGPGAARSGSKTTHLGDNELESASWYAQRTPQLHTASSTARIHSADPAAPAGRGVMGSAA